MSANDVIYIDRKTFKVYYSGCADNPLDEKRDLIGKGASLEDAVDIAQTRIKEMRDDGCFTSPEYGINFINWHLNKGD